MAGKKKNQGGKATKDSAVPKSVAGVKVPKGIRTKLASLAKHPVVADVLAAGLAAITARLKTDSKEPEATQTAVPPAPQAEATPAPTNVTKRARKPAAPKAEAAPAATPVTRRTRKPAAASTASAPVPVEAPAAAVRRRKPAGEAAAKPAPRGRKAAESSTVKPRATRRTTPKKPTPPKSDG